VEKNELVNTDIARTLGETSRFFRLLALPMNKRTHFLRVRLPGGGSAL
jgi:hypothetical protein